MSEPKSELIIAYATPPDAPARARLEAALTALAVDPKNPLPHLRQALMRRMVQPLQTDAEGAFGFAMPHEQALAQTLGWSDAQPGQLPLAALEAQQRGLLPTDAAWAWVSPCHWAVGTQQVVLETPAQLQLTLEESRRLWAAVNPLFEEDGIRLHCVDAHRWLAEGEVFRQVRTAAIERAAGRDVVIWLPEGEAGKPLRRLQSELQMFLYHHPDAEAMTEQRRAQGLRAVNSFWFSGSGALPAPDSANALSPTASQPDLQLPMREAALRNDLDEWARCWLALDAALGQGLLPDNANLTLCGEQGFRTWQASPRSGSGPKKTESRWRQQIQRLLNPLTGRRNGSANTPWHDATQDL
jgi:hypothetical protein